jgi:hypothetical protein
MTTKTYLLIVWLSLLAVVMGLYATGPESIDNGKCGPIVNIGQVCEHRAAAWERVWFAVVGE